MIALAVFAAAAVAITWPLARHAGSHVVLGNISALGDPWVVGGALAAASRALVGSPSGGIYHPTPLSFFYGETGAGALPLYAPAFLATGNPVLALNVVFLGGLTLTAWSLDAVVRRWTDSRPAGLLAGLTFLASPFAAWSWGPSAFNYVTLWYWPWIVCATAAPLAGWRATAGLAALVFLQGLSSAYVAAGVFVPAAALAAARLVRPAARASGARLVVALAIALLGWAAAFAPYVAVHLREPVLARQTLYPYLPRFAQPTNLFAPGEPSGIAPAALVAIAAGAVLALRGTPRRRTWIVAAGWTAIGLLLALPPRLAIGGWTVVSPAGWLVDAGVPLHALRDDGRRGLAALIGLSLLVGLAWAEIAAALGRWRAGAIVPGTVGAALAAGIIAGLARTPVRHGTEAATPGRYPLFDAAAASRLGSRMVEALRRESGPLLELPTAPGPIIHADAMHRAAVHGRPLLNGLHGYWPREFPRRMALACRLPDRDALAALRRDTGVALLLVHLEPLPIGRPVGPYACPPRPAGPPGDDDAPWNRTPWETLARDGRDDLELVMRDGSDLLFRLR